MGSEWYVARDGKTYGPFTSEEMSAGVRDGELRRDDLVWRKGIPYWQPAAEAPGLWSAIKPPALAAPSREPATVAAAVARPAEASVRTDARREAEAYRETERTAPRRVGFIRRHWRGELSLTKAYWGVGFLLTVLVIGVATVFGLWLGPAKLSPVAGGIAMVGFLSFLCVMTV